MRLAHASVLAVLLLAKAARGFVLPAVAASALRGRTRAAPLSLVMNKALQRPGHASADAKSVGIIGGGIAGLVCAKRLKELGLSPTVFDTGKREVGGRVSSRLLQVPSKASKGTVTVKVDHSTQFFTATDERFAALVTSLRAQGAVREWTGPVGTLQDGAFQPLGDAERKLWVGCGGIDAVPKALAKDLRTVLNCWVAVVERQEGSGKWRLFRDNARKQRLSDERGQDFDYLVVAHNGKCAERLMRDAQVPTLHRLLKTKFACTPPPAGLMQLSSLWVCTFVVEKSLGLPYEGVFIKGHPDLCWAADNTKKMAAAEKTGDLESWTLISSRPYGTANKVPQEAVPPDVQERVAREMMRAFETSAGLPVNSIQPVAQYVQLWGAGVPMNVLAGPGCVLDGDAAAGICGDWVEQPCVEGAALSGIEMAEALAQHAAGKLKSIGIPSNYDRCMEPVATPACGAFPGLAVTDALPPQYSPRGGGADRGGRGGGGGRGGLPGGGRVASKSDFRSAAHAAKSSPTNREEGADSAGGERGGAQGAGRARRGGRGRVQSNWAVSLDIQHLLELCMLVCKKANL